jgi:uncharacterized damage-inducible protein DinB
MGDVLQAAALPGFEPEIGRWLWALEEVRRGTVATLKGLSQEILDWEGHDGQENAVGSLLYHIALVEMSWLYMDIFEQDLPVEVKADFPYDMADSERRLARVLGVPLADHLARLERSRKRFLETVRGISLRDWRQLRSPGDVEYQVTPEWAVFHLIEHEAGHAFQIRAMKARATRVLARQP